MKSAKIVVPYKGENFSVKVDLDKKSILEDKVYLRKESNGSFLVRFKKSYDSKQNHASRLILKKNKKFSANRNVKYLDGNPLNITSRNLYQKV